MNEFKELIKTESKHYELGAERNAFLEGVSFALRQEYANQVKPEWVSVHSDILPGTRKVMWLHKNEMIVIGTVFGIMSEHDQFTHWMYLPEIPK